jgi:hypothetical protein
MDRPRSEDDLHLDIYDSAPVPAPANRRSPPSPVEHTLQDRYQLLTCKLQGHPRCHNCVNIHDDGEELLHLNSCTVALDLATPRAC